jgi:hypothetical protein
VIYLRHCEHHQLSNPHACPNLHHCPWRTSCGWHAESTVCTAQSVKSLCLGDGTGQCGCNAGCCKQCSRCTRYSTERRT